jgi:hypothetical protein
MGYTAQDLNPLNPAAPTPLIPERKEYAVVPFDVTRSMTATNVKQAVLPADATILGFRLYGTVASNATTTATIHLYGQGVGPSGATFDFGTFDVKGTYGAGTFLLPTTVNLVTGTFNAERPPATQTSGDIYIYATYAETGTASTAGGPWYIVVEYVR